MATYTTTEIYNELSKVLLSTVSSSRESGVSNTKDEYQQLLLLTSLTLLLNPSAMFYLIRLSANKLNAEILDEVAYLNDILTSLESLDQVGVPVTNTTAASNASTALLALDGAGTVQGRHELTKFTSLVAEQASLLGKNVVSQGGELVQPRDAARNAIRLGFAAVQEKHQQVLTHIAALASAMSEYDALDIPSKASASIISGVRKSISDYMTATSLSSESENVANSRQYVLSLLTSQAIVGLLAKFRSPMSLKFRSPVKPIPATAKHYGQGYGEVTTPSVSSASGPWQTPLASPLVLAVNGGGAQTLAVESLVPGLHGSASEPFAVTPGSRLHVVVDPNTYDGVVDFGGVSEVRLQNPKIPLGFRHLGCGVSFPDSTRDGTSSTLYPRAIRDLTMLEGFAWCSWNPSNSSVDLALPQGIGYDSWDTTHDYHVGGYIKDVSGVRFRITGIRNSESVYIDARGLTPNTLGTVWVCGQGRPGLPTYFSFDPLFPAGYTPDNGHRVQISPSVKSTEISGTSLAAVIAEINSSSGPTSLGWHVQASSSVLRATSLALKLRDQQSPYLQISPHVVEINTTTPSPPTIVYRSCHEALGFSLGGRPCPTLPLDDHLSAVELAAEISKRAVGVTAVAVGDTVALSSKSIKQGAAIQVLSGPASLGFPSGKVVGGFSSFCAKSRAGDLLTFDGVEVGDLLHITGVGDVEIASVADTVLGLASPIPATVKDAPFTIRSASIGVYSVLSTWLQEFLATTLSINRYNQNLDKLDAALTSALAVGQNFQSSRAAAKAAFAELVKLLETVPPQLANYSAVPVSGVDRVTAAFLDRRYDRAVDLLLSTRIRDFYATDEETGSYSGNMMAASRTAVQDLPSADSSEHAIDEQLNVASSVVLGQPDTYADTTGG